MQIALLSLYGVHIALAYGEIVLSFSACSVAEHALRLHVVPIHSLTTLSRPPPLLPRPLLYASTIFHTPLGGVLPHVSFYPAVSPHCSAFPVSRRTWSSSDGPRRKATFYSVIPRTDHSLALQQSWVQTSSSVPRRNIRLWRLATAHCYRPR